MNYEYLITDTPENMRKVLEWIIAGEAEILTSGNLYSWWERTTDLVAGHAYQRTKSESQSQFLTDVEEIRKGIKEGKVLYCPSGRDATNPKNWGKAECARTGGIEYCLDVGGKYKYAEELFLTNAEDISRGVKARIVMTTLETETGTQWTVATESNPYLIQQRLRQGSKYKLVPGMTLPPGVSEFLTDPEEISKGIKEGKILTRHMSTGWSIAWSDDINTVKQRLDNGCQYKYAEVEYVDLTDPIQIMHHILDGTALVYTCGVWAHTGRADINEIVRNLHNGMKYKAKK